MQYAICTKCFKQEEGRELSEFCQCGYMRLVKYNNTAREERARTTPLSKQEIEELLWKGTTG